MGVVLYPRLTGRLPFERASLPEIVAGVLSSPPTHLSKLDRTIPAALCNAIMRALSKEPADRLATMREFGSEVHDACRVARAALEFAETATLSGDDRPRRDR